MPNLPEHPSKSFDVRQLHHLWHDVSETAYKELFSDDNSMTCSSSYFVQEQSSADQLARWLAVLISMIDEILQNAELWLAEAWDRVSRIRHVESLRLGWWLEKWRHTSGLKGLRPASLMKVLQCVVALTRRSTQLFNGSMTYAPTTNAPARNANVEAYIKPDPDMWDGRLSSARNIALRRRSHLGRNMQRWLVNCI